MHDSLISSHAVYRGQFGRFNGNKLGLRAIINERFELDAGFAGSFGSGGKVIAARTGMPTLGKLVEFGPRIKGAGIPVPRL